MHSPTKKMARSIISVCKYLSQNATFPFVRGPSLYVARPFSATPNDKAKPKKPMSPFFLYNQRVRNELNLKYPGAKLTEKVKIASGMYKNLADVEKQKLLEESARLLVEYRAKLDNWYNSLSDQEKKDLKENVQKARQKRSKMALKKMQKKSNKPKRPKIAYILFCESVWGSLMDKYPSTKDRLVKLSKECAQMWKNLSDSQKQVFQDKAKQLKEEYDVALNNWETEMVASGHQNLLSKAAQKKLSPKTSRKRKASSKSKAAKKSSAGKKSQSTKAEGTKSTGTKTGKGPEGKK